MPNNDVEPPSKYVYKKIAAFYTQKYSLVDFTTKFQRKFGIQDDRNCFEIKMILIFTQNSLASGFPGLVWTSKTVLKY